MFTGYQENMSVIIYPTKPNFYVVKMGFTEVQFSIFIAEKIICILHGHIFECALYSVGEKSYLYNFTQKSCVFLLLFIFWSFCFKIPDLGQPKYCCMRITCPSRYMCLFCRLTIEDNSFSVMLAYYSVL